LGFQNAAKYRIILPKRRDNAGGLLILTPDIKTMSKTDTSSTLKRLQNRYRLVVMNEDTYEEVVKFRLSRLSVYVVLSSVFVLLTFLTVALIIFTPIKYYLPGVGYGDAKQVKEFKSLKMRTDSMETALKFRQQYLDDLQKVLQGKVPTLDTSRLDLPSVEKYEE
jgi:Sec-independent protein translocase protein TatA